MVALKNKLLGDLIFCGGSLIAQDTVLTAAHCMYGLEDIYHLVLYAVIGRDDLTSLSGEEVSVVSVMLHPNFDNNTLVNQLQIILNIYFNSLIYERHFK